MNILLIVNKFKHEKYYYEQFLENIKRSSKNP